MATIAPCLPTAFRDYKTAGNHTWTKPDNLAYVVVEVLGAGGTGAGVSSTSGTAGGSSSFGSHAVATGGAAGTRSGTSGYYGLGGEGTVGSLLKKASTSSSTTSTFTGGAGNIFVYNYMSPFNFGVGRTRSINFTTGAITGDTVVDGTGVGCDASALVSGTDVASFGGDGGYAYAIILAKDLADSVTITVGAGASVTSYSSAGNFIARSSGGRVIVTEFTW